MVLRARETLEGPESAQSCARQILEVVPRAMRLVREQMREEAGKSLSVPQFRVLAYLGRNPGSPLKAVASHVGVATATASVMVERLVRRRLIVRAGDPEERRCVRLKLTAQGAEVVERSRGRARERVAERLGALSGPELSELSRGLSLLERALSVRGEGEERR